MRSSGPKARTYPAKLYATALHDTGTACSAFPSVHHDRGADVGPVVDPEHVVFGEVDAAVRAAIEGQRIPVWQVRAGAELVAPPGIVQEEAVVGEQHRIVDRRRRIP